MTDQNAQSGAAATTATPATDQNAQSATSTTTGSNAADQNAANANNANAASQGQGNANGLPQTASPLPLLGLLGLGSFFTGLIARFRK
ncbi:MAG TPA: hypothetical protein VG498_06415 [Terriglobales bacterium]|nr:hypothetical protein [Terriglobales bacterium]